MAVKAGAEEGSIDLETFSNLIEENPQSIYLVDVRDPDEFAAGHFQTAVNIPVGELEDKVDSLPAEKPIVFVCSTGARSGESYYMLQDIKPELKKVYYLEAEVEYSNDGSYKIIKTSSEIQVTNQRSPAEHGSGPFEGLPHTPSSAGGR